MIPTTHEINLETAKRYHAGNNAVVRMRGFADAGVMLKMRTPEGVQARVEQIIAEEIMPVLETLAVMGRRKRAA